MSKLRGLAILMGVTILGITGFQLYWLKNNYDRERQSLDIKTNSAFRQTILRLQSSKLKLDQLSVHFDEHIAGAAAPVRPAKRTKIPDTLGTGREPAITIINLLEEKMKDPVLDSLGTRGFIFSEHDSMVNMTLNDSTRRIVGGQMRSRLKTVSIYDSAFSAKLKDDIELRRKMRTADNGNRVITLNYRKTGDSSSSTSEVDKLKGRVLVRRPMQTAIEEGEDVLTARNGEMFRFLYNVDSISVKDSVTVKEITDAYANRLREEKIDIPFTVNRIDSAQSVAEARNEVIVGFVNPAIYRLNLQEETTFLLRKLTWPILFSLFLIGITIASFVLLYRNLLHQKRLAQLKNEFISNITHELKTPIATVGVAIEALKNFNALHDPDRTKEYLDISQNELQRLSLLVDKVLKLSMFEKKEMELKKEQFDCRQLTQEVLNSMKLQFNKFHARVKLHAEGENFIIEADKLHITSVIYNLLDNALKYGSENPAIDVTLVSTPSYVSFSVTDNGIGIAPLYKEKIFEKFFRVPAGDKHNIKGYGLGLSYVAEVVKRHQGKVLVESEPGKGSTFTAQFPYATA